MSVRVEPATVLDLAALSGAATRQQWADARELMAAGTLLAFRAGDELVALAGFVPIPDAEDWAQMVFNPAPAARRHMLGILATGRLTIVAAPYRGILTVCGTDAGRLFARRLGFVFQAAFPIGEVWAYGRSSLGRQAGPDAEGAAAAGGTDRGEPADQPGADRGGAGAA